MVDPDYAVKLLEGASRTPTRLPEDQRDRLLRVLSDLAEAEPSPQRREFLASFPFTAGLAEQPSNRTPANSTHVGRAPLPGQRKLSHRTRSARAGSCRTVGAVAFRAITERVGR
ncbi:hypothetical protein [Kitasatospora griseola]|uniref:hypothetical protein n=1 Tax=Kitasatospora griseola TaxID=2064 RepID=UPI003802472D